MFDLKKYLEKKANKAQIEADTAKIFGPDKDIHYWQGKTKAFQELLAELDFCTDCDELINKAESYCENWVDYCETCTVAHSERNMESRGEGNYIEESYLRARKEKYGI